jgi:hypothetical protein
MDSRWVDSPYGMVDIPWIPDEMVDIPWIPDGMVHGIHMESMELTHSIWNPWKMDHSTWNPWTIPSGIHGIHPFHMESIWNTPGSVKYCRQMLNFI